jgi:hypothetical protein
VYPFVPPHEESGEVMPLGVELEAGEDEARVDNPGGTLLGRMLELSAPLKDETPD